MLRLETVQRLRLTVAVPEADLGTIAEGMQSKFSVRTWPGEQFIGVVRRIAGAVDVRTRTMPVELDVDNPTRRLAPGAFAEVIWPVHRAELSLVVPPGAIVQSTDKTYVDRVQDGVVEQVAVRRGVVLQDRVEVFGPLKAGELVLARGTEELKDGVRVTPWEADKNPRGTP
jgi:RND family efflux transporter MFP subunit